MKKLVLLILTVCIAILSFAACDSIIPKPDTDPPGQGNQNQEPENLIYALGSELAIVLGEGIVADDLTALWEEIGVASGNYAQFVTDSTKPAAHEIVVGKSTRPVSVEAYRLLDRIQQNNKHDYRMLLYSDGSSIAFAYDDDSYDVALGKVVAYLRENCVKEQLTVAKGTVFSDNFDIIEELSALDMEEKQVAWEKFQKNLTALAGEANAKAITEEFKSFYQLFNSGLVTWMANLFDPDICVCDSLYGLTECEGHELCGTAGFYFTSSGRDTKGFLPIVEAMKSVMAFVGDMGLTDMSAVKYFPAEYVDRMGQFVYHLQDPNGYFYHPQWGKDIGISRLGRDYGWCVSLLNRFGLKSKYPLLDSVPEAEETASKSYLPSRFGASVASLASKVVAAESEIYIPYYLVDIPAFEAYLEDLWTKGSYSAGSQLSTIRSQIQAREKTTGMPFGETVMDFLDSKQLDNGIWHEKTDYDGINGVMKIMGMYGAYKRPVKNIDLTLKASINAILSDEVPSAIVEVWNPWSALSSCLSNLNTCYSAEEATAYRQELYSLIPEAIRKSKEYDAMFLKTDGSFSYHPTKATATMMGYPCGVPNTNEGDMDGSILASTYMVSSIASVLGVSPVKVFGDAEGLMFMEIIESASPIRKAGGGEVLGEPMTFDEMEVGEVPGNIKFGRDSIKGIIVQEEDAERGKSYQITNSKAWETITIGCDNPGAKNPSCYVYEGDFLFEKITYVKANAETMRIDLGTGGDNKSIYRILFVPDSTAQRISLWDSSSIDTANAVKNDFGISVGLNEWFKLRIECYTGDASNIRFKIYFNGKLAAVTNNFYNRDGSKVTNSDVAPNTGYTAAVISSDSSNDPIFRIDNVHAYNSNDVYVYSDLEIPGGVNVDEKIQDEKVYSFDELEDGASYSELTLGEAATVVSDAEGNKYLSLPALSSVSVPAALRQKDPNCLSFSLDIAEYGNYIGEVAKISWVEKNSPNRTMTGFVISSDMVDGVLTANITELLSGNIVPGVSFPLSDFSNVRFDYYTKEGVVLIYLGEQKVGMSMSTDSLASRMTFGHVAVEASGNACVDNIKCEKTLRSFDEATASKYPEIVHGKDNVGFDAITTKGDVKSVTTAGDLELTMGKTSLVQIPVNLRDDATNVSVVEFTMKADASARGNQQQLFLYDEEGQIILAFAFVAENGKMVIRESTAYGTHVMNIAEFELGKEAKLTFEYFAVEGECNVYVDGVCVFVTSLYYYADTRYNVPTMAELSSYTTSATATLDDLKCERVNKMHVDKNLSYTNPENGAEKLTFEYSTITSLPNAISSSFRDPGTYITLSESLNNNGEATKAMLFHSVKGNYDTVTFKPTKVCDTVNSHVFESDFCFSGDNITGNYFEINFMSKDNGSSYKAYRLTFTFAEDSVVLNENNNSSVKYDIASINKWFNLRVEYYVTNIGGEPALRVNVLVDGEIIYVGQALYSDSTTPAALRENVYQVQVNATKNTAGTVLLDNVSYTQSDATYTGD